MVEELKLDSELINDLHLNGLLGLSDRLSQHELVSRSQIVAEKHRGHFKKNVFSLYLNKSWTLNSPDESDTNPSGSVAGALILGGIDKRFYRGEFSYVDASPEDGKVYLNEISLSWPRLGEHHGPTDETVLRDELDEYNADVVFDGSIILIGGSKNLVRPLHERYLGAKEFEKNYFKFEDCSLEGKPGISFHLGQVRLVLEPKDYVVEMAQDDEPICASAIRVIGGQSFVFGATLLKNYYTVSTERTN